VEEIGIGYSYGGGGTSLAYGRLGCGEDRNRLVMEEMEPL